MASFPRRWWLRGVLAVVVASLLVPPAASVVTDDRAPGHSGIEAPTANHTIVSVQGVRFGAPDGPSPAHLFVVDDAGNVTLRFNGTDRGLRWLYDVDPLPNGNLLVTSTVPGDTVVFELDLATKTRVWTQRLDAHDTHDVDLIDGDELLVANMRNFDESTGVSHDRLFVYNLTRNEIVWEWQFRDHYPPSTDGGHGEEWTHLNDVDKVAEDLYLASPRDFDQAIVVNRSSGEIAMRLGEDDNRTRLFKQHNPDYLAGENGTATLLVADSENDRVVEYARVDGGWERTWAVTGFHWPRDADRLPNGNTLVTDTKNDRVVEITPTGEIVWNVSAKWGPYEAERGRDGSHGPTIREQNATGAYRVHGGTETDAETTRRVGDGTLVDGRGPAMGHGLGSADARLGQTWPSEWTALSLAAAAAVALAWGIGEAAYRYRRPAGDD